ncbi:hypothetical protein BT96DRAFT_32700 [Gymnopus androsaceus JB14]|uniref:Uncharacterized protein n=1 Tax=Gymnopus androsaceus JB14 TaxID=1447944 RepID=A0A6A4HK91_9AGAR|nr:hypothetical protein BT96DRAFT_32700 [Gymnopus androsaceus JB14]
MTMWIELDLVMTAWTVSLLHQPSSTRPFPLLTGSLVSASISNSRTRLIRSLRRPRSVMIVLQVDRPVLKQSWAPIGVVHVEHEHGDVGMSI